jgi:alginate O-acetyltransferase complex protein AlgI
MVGSAWFWLALGGLVAVGALRPALRGPLTLAVSLALVASWDWRALAVLVPAWALLVAFGPRLAAGGPTGRRLTYAFVAALVALLLGFKLTFEGSSVAAPLGLSYFVFKLLHYTIEVARGRFAPAPPAALARWLCLFPVFVAGPIERWDSFRDGHTERLSRDDLEFGLTRIVHGLIAKFVVAEMVGTRLMALVPFATLDASLPAIPAWRLWAALFGVGVYVYFDFSGYSSMGLGAARLLGWRLAENFDRPWLSTNVGEWWRRWHISLSGWCRDYVYLPVLGLTRRPIVSGYASMLIMASWHHLSVNWLLWGLYHGSCLGIFQLWQQLKRRKKWRRTPGLAERIALRIVTAMVIVASYAFTTTNALGPVVGLEALCALVGLRFR